MVEPVYTNDIYTVWPDRVQQANFRACALSDATLQSNYSMEQTVVDHVRVLTKDLTHYPQHHSPQPRLACLYRLSL